MALVAGADGCKFGWVVAMGDSEEARLEFFHVPNFGELASNTSACPVVGIDIPIGLLDEAVAGGRPPDKLGRKLLKGKRASSVFSPPVYDAACARTYQDALKINRHSSPLNIGLSAQCFGIAPKIIEVNRSLCNHAALRERFREIHPEISFYIMNNEQPVLEAKRKREGRETRLRLLRQQGLSCLSDEVLGQWPRSRVQPDDIIDAAAAWWSARRLLRGEAVILTGEPSHDSRGLRMEICG